MQSIVLFFLILTFFIFSFSFSITCNIKSSCSAGETCLFKMFDLNNSHASTCDFNYNYSLCCSDVEWVSVRTNSCNPNEVGIISLAYLNNSHVEVYRYTNYPYHICSKFKVNREIIVGVRNNSCDNDEVPLASIYSLTNSHIAQYNYYDYKLCLSNKTVLILISLNKKSFWYNETIYSSIKVIRIDGSPLNNSDIWVSFEKELKCSGKTDNQGKFNCSFSAPLKIGIFNLEVKVYDNSLQRYFFNNTAVEVKLLIGEETERAKIISCREEPRIIIGPDGFPQVVNVKVCIIRE